MEALNRGLSDAPFQMITILNNDRPQFADTLRKKIGFTFPVLIDPDSQTAQQYGLTGVPETFIVDPEGILREKFIGPRPWNSQEAFKMLSKYMPHQPTADK